MQQLMTTKDMANYLKISPSTIYKLAEKGEIPASKVGGAWRINKEVLDSWLNSQGLKSRGMVLVVDDDESCRQILCEMLVAVGYRVDVASTGREGLSLAKHKDYELLLADLGMPDISGVDLVAEVKTNSPKTQAALVTGWGMQIDPIDLQKGGVVNVIKKPFTEEEILTIVGQLLDERADPK